MQHFYKKYGTSTTKSLLRIQHDTHKIIMQKIWENCEIDKNDELAASLYTRGVSLYANRENNNRKISNEVIQLLTVSADLGNNDSILWLRSHDGFITECLAENLDMQTYKLFIDRCNTEHNKYSLNMLGVINNTCNNPTITGRKETHNGLSAGEEQGLLAHMYYTQSGDKGNPTALLNLAYMLYDDYFEDRNNCSDSNYDSDNDNDSDDDNELPDDLKDKIKSLIVRAKKLGIEDKILKGIV